MGISTLAANKDLEELIKEADDALYTAKEKGRNNVVVTNNDRWEGNDEK